ncbi:DNA translocase FtsK [Pseudalkalibacillus hwajinpoensis]|uniref:DNA translocase FtsK n=1 Tax=Guptibacillus hwajinpoensis TaxID=208199 RepID=UPI00325BE372
MDNNWIKKVWNRLFDLEGEEEEEPVEKNKNEAPGLKQEHRVDRKHSIGRMESANRKNEARVVHQYPREGNFRFPLIPDHSNNRIPKKQNNNDTERNQTGNPKKHSHVDQSSFSAPKKPITGNSTRKVDTDSTQKGQSKKFSGVNFKPSDIPSPIYGFSKRPVVEKMEEAAKSSEESRYTPLQEHKMIDKLIDDTEKYSPENESMTVSKGTDEQIQNDLPFSVTRKVDPVEPVDQIDNSEPVQVTSNSVENTTDGTYQENEHIQDMEDQVVEVEHVIEREPVQQAETDQDDSSASTSKPLLQEEESEANAEPFINDYEAIVDEKHEPQQELPVEVSFNSMDIGVSSELTLSRESEEETEGSQADEPHIDLQDEEVQESENQQMEKNQLLNPENQREESREREKPEVSGKREESRPKPQVPYNVMMLANDRRQLTRKPGSSAEYKLPPISLLDIPPRNEGSDDQWLEDQRELLESTLENFNVQAKVVGATMGPTVTRFEVQPSPGVKVNKITNLSDDIKLSLAARDIRMEAPIPGKNAIGIEVPNPTSKPVFIREIVRSGAFQSEGSLLNAALGFDIAGEAKITDIQKMPHGLIAGATGSGKSVCINSILVSLLLKANPNDVKMMLIDPKMVELAPYNGLPHLVTPVINDVKEATTALKWAVDEMEERYEKFAAAGVRDITRYNERAINHGEPQHKLPYIVIVIDELADLMMVSPQDVEDAICRIAQKARACGIHLLVATQRPSVDVITGLIKANIPTRIAFSVSSQIDSRTILDTSGAEKLLGKGDMLCLENGSSKPVRLQGNFVSDEEIERVTSFVRKQRKPNYLIQKEDLMKKQQYNDQEDDLFEEACMWAIDQGQASSSALQRRFRIGFNRAARLIEMMEERGLVSEAMGSKPRSILLSKSDFEETYLKDMHV